MILDTLTLAMKAIRDTLIKFLIIMTIISTLYFWLCLFEATGNQVAFAAIQLIGYSMILIFVSGTAYFIFKYFSKLQFKKEMSKVKVHVSHK